MCRCATGSIRKGEWQRTELLNCGASEGTLLSPLHNKEINQSIWKEINLWPLLSQLRHRLRASRWKEWMFPLQKCLTVAAPVKEFVAPPLQEAQKGWRLCVPWVPRYTCSILPSSTGGQGRGNLGPGGGGWLRDPLGPSFTSRTRKNRAGVWSRELVTVVWEQEGTSSAWTTSPKLRWRRSPVTRSSEVGRRESISLPLRIPLNEEVVELEGHHKHFHGLDHPPAGILGVASPQLQSCSSGGNWESCVLLGQGQWPCKASHRTPWPCQDGWSGAV